MKYLCCFVVLLFCGSFLFGQVNWARLNGDTLTCMVDNQKYIISSTDLIDKSLSEMYRINDKDIYAFMHNKYGSGEILLIKTKNKNIKKLVNEVGSMCVKPIQTAINHIYYHDKSDIVDVSKNNTIRYRIGSNDIYAVSPDKKNIAFSHMASQGNLFNYKVQPGIVDTIYSYDLNDSRDYDNQKYDHVGVNTSLIWADNKNLCYGASRKGLIIVNMKTKAISQLFNNYRFEGTISKWKDKLLLVSVKNNSDKMILCDVSIKNKTIRELFVQEDLIYDAKWQDESHIVYKTIKDDTKYLILYDIISGQKKEIAKTNKRTETFCFIE
jgi:hypothetical protein